MKRLTTLNIILCAMFAALSAVLSQTIVPIGAVPINLAHISIFLAAGLLGAKYGTISQTVFVLIGLAGAPVFSGFSGGVAKVMGPTGGFIIGYIFCALITGIIADCFGRSVISMIAAMIAGLAVNYALGTVWFMYVMDAGFAKAFLVCVAPFLIGDASKIAISAILVNRLAPLCGKHLFPARHKLREERR